MKSTTHVTFPGAAGILCGPSTGKFDAELLDAAGGSLKVIGTYSAGHDHLDKRSLRERGVRVGTLGNLDLLSESVAEHTVLLILMTALKANRHIRALREQEWGDFFGAPLYGFNGQLLAGKTLGVFGFGRIGQGVAERMTGFDLKEIVYAARTDKGEAGVGPGARKRRVVEGVAGAATGEEVGRAVGQGCAVGDPGDQQLQGLAGRVDQRRRDAQWDRRVFGP